MVLGVGMLVWSGVIHIHLWTAGYRSIPVIGWLFLFQAIAAFVLGAVVLITRHPVPATIGALLLGSTAVGLVWSVEWGLFGFQDSFDAPLAMESLGVESAGAVVLILASVLAWRGRRRRDARERRGNPRRTEAEPRLLISIAEAHESGARASQIDCHGEV